MRALILRNDPNAAMACSSALIEKGFQILCVDTRDVAETLVRLDLIDLLVMDERVQGDLTHTVALSGERHNPYVSTILMTDRPGDETDELYDLIPSLYALAGTETMPKLVGQLAVAAVTNTTETIARVAENAAADRAEADAPDEAIAAFEEMAPIKEAAKSNHEFAAWNAMIAKEAAAAASSMARATVQQAKAAEPAPAGIDDGLPMIPDGAVRVPSLAARMRVGSPVAAFETDEETASPFARRKTPLPQFVDPKPARPQPAA